MCQSFARWHKISSRREEEPSGVRQLDGAKSIKCIWHTERWAVVPQVLKNQTFHLVGMKTSVKRRYWS